MVSRKLYADARWTPSSAYATPALQRTVRMVRRLGLREDRSHRSISIQHMQSLHLEMEHCLTQLLLLHGGLGA